MLIPPELSRVGGGEDIEVEVVDDDEDGDGDGINISFKNKENTCKLIDFNIQDYNSLCLSLTYLEELE